MRLKKAFRSSPTRFTRIQSSRPGDHLNSSFSGNSNSVHAASKQCSKDLTLLAAILMPPVANNGPILARLGVFCTEKQLHLRSSTSDFLCLTIYSTHFLYYIKLYHIF